MSDNVTEFPAAQETETHQEERESLLMQPDAALLESVRDIYARVKKERNKRAEINKAITAIWAELETLGVDKQAAKHVFRYMEMEEEQRRFYDLSASLVRKAQGAPLQGDLFAEKQIDATRKMIEENLKEG